jgi:hypothetical protein
VDPLTWLPKPIGQSTNPKVGLANEIRTVIDDATNGALSVLPKPVKPSAAQTPPANLPTGTSTAFGEGAATPSAKPIEKPSKSTTLNVRSLLTSHAGANARAKSDVKNVDATVRPSKAKHRKTESIKDRVTRALSGRDHTKPGKAERVKSSGAAA